MLERASGLHEEQKGWQGRERAVALGEELVVNLMWKVRKDSNCQKLWVERQWSALKSCGSCSLPPAQEILTFLRGEALSLILVAAGTLGSVRSRLQTESLIIPPLWPFLHPDAQIPNTHLGPLSLYTASNASRVCTLPWFCSCHTGLSWTHTEPANGHPAHFVTVWSDHMIPLLKICH